MCGRNDQNPESAPALVLASGSPRRSELLARAGLIFEIDRPGVDETAPEGASPAEEASFAAALKCAEVARRRQDAVVLAADTVVELDGRSLGKPSDRDEARAMLQALSGRTHSVITGVCIERRSAGKRREFIVSSAVAFDRFGPAAMDEYLSSVDVMDKAGAYGIQELSDLLGARVEGSVDNVIGLPLAEVVDALREFGIGGRR